MPTFTAPTAVPYRSAAQTNANPAMSPRRRYLLPDECPIKLAAYGFEQSYEMLLSSFPPAALNTPANASALGSLSDSNAILTGYYQPSPIGAGVGQFDASFQIVPASWDDYKLISFTFPGFPGTLGAQYTRDVFTDNVQVRLRHDYYVIDPSGIAAGVVDSAGAAIKTVASLAAIPIIAKTNFVTVYSGAAQPATRVNSLIKSGGDNIGGVTYLETCPTRENYIAWVAKAKADRWSGTVWDGTYTNQSAGTISQFVIEDSRLEALAGNIIDRVTTYILAK